MAKSKQTKELEFSVIIPSFNRPEQTAKAISSIEQQSVQPVEIIVVDDGSQPPLEIENTELPIRLIRHDENKGAAAARNTGLSAAKTDWVTFLDSDDRLKPDSLEARVDCIDPSKPYNIYGCAWTVETIDGDYLFTEFPGQATSPTDHLAGIWFSPGSCIFINRVRVLETAGLQDEQMRRYEDYEWFIRLSQSGFKYFPSQIVGAILTRNRSVALDVAKQSAFYTLRKLSLQPEKHSNQRKIAAYLYLEVAAACFYNSKPVQMLYWLFLSFLKYPRLTVNLLPSARERKQCQ